MKTHHAPAERSNQDKIDFDSEIFKNEETIVAISEASNTMFLILNKNRQIVLGNKKLLKVLGSNLKDIIGKRPGEALQCINATAMEAGCGTSQFCAECGAVNAIMKAINGDSTDEECRITSVIKDRRVSFDLSVKAEPFVFNAEKYVLFSVVDISDSKRREILERTFFHDVLNTAGGIHGLSQFLNESLKDAGAEDAETADLIYNLSDALISEIRAHQQLMAAESNTLQLSIEGMFLAEYLELVIGFIKKNIESNHIKIVLEECENLEFKSDRVLLQRVLVNMIKNAAEASKEDQQITVKARVLQDHIQFSVHNQSYIEESVQRQIFQRSFSTKGHNRGIGTYSMRLFGEEYLRGKVWFESSESAGTTFYLEIPSDRY